MLPSTAAGLPLDEALRQLTAFVVGGVCMNMLIKWCVPESWAVPTRNAARDADGAAYYSHVLCCVVQAFCFPTLLLLSVLQYPDLRAHCASSWEECGGGSGSSSSSSHGLPGDVCWMRVLAMVMISYLVKDLPFCNTMEVVHHVSGVVVTLGFCFQERGMFGFMTGCVTLECANFFMNVAHIWPYEGASRLTMHRVNVAANTLSHVVGLYVTYFTFVNRGPEDSTAFFAIFSVASLAVMYVRQQLNYGNYCIVRDFQRKSA